MSSAEPFMPAHEPAAPVAPQEHDIDHGVDVIFGSPDPDAPVGEPEPWHTGDAPTMRRFVPGDHLSAEQLATDFELSETQAGTIAETDADAE